MKVVCETCHTRYSIADDKIRGKAFKIKCKKCGAFMIVRAAADSGDDASPAAESDGDGTSEMGDAGAAPPIGEPAPSADAQAQEQAAASSGDDFAPASAATGDAFPADAESESAGAAPQDDASASLAAASEASQAPIGDPADASADAPADAGAGVEPANSEKETRVFNYAEFERLMADKAEDSTPAAVASSVTQTGSGTPEWYLLIGDEQDGPLTENDVEQRIRRGEVDGETYAWREGLEDWKPLREVSQLSGLLAAASRAPEMVDSRVDAPPSDFGPLPTSSSSSGVASTGHFSAGGFEEDSPLAGSDSLSGAASTGGGFDYSSSVPEPASEPQKMTGQRHEDSVLFSLKSLGVVNFQEGKGSGAKVVESGGGGRSMESIASKEMRLGSSSSSGSSLDVPLPPPIVVPPARTGLSSSAKIMIASSSIVTVAAVVVVVVMLTRNSGPTPPPPAPRPTTPVVAKPTPPPVPPTKPPTPEGGKGTKVAALTAAQKDPPGQGEDKETEVEEPAPGRKARGRRRRRSRRRRGRRRSVGRTARPAATASSASDPVPALPSSLPDPTPPRRRVSRRAAPQPDSEIRAILEGSVPAVRSRRVAPTQPKVDTSLPETISQSVVRRTIRRNTSGIVRCYNRNVKDKAKKKGTLRVKFTIRRNGRTRGIRVRQPLYWGSAFVGCVGSTVRRWRFPKFRGDEIEITYPFILGGF